MGFFQDAWRSQFQKINRVKGDETPKEVAEGVVNEPIDQLALEMTDEELIDLKGEWITAWDKSGVKKEWEEKCAKNFEYYKGIQDKTTDERKLQDNVLFEAVETLRPIAGRQNPEPTVDADNTDAGNELADRIKKMLVFEADQLSLKNKGGKVLLHWLLSYIGVAKVGWNMEENDIDLQVIRPQTMILDPDATIENGRYYGSYLGQILSDTARDLMTRFPEMAEQIAKKVENKLGSKVQFGEWWTHKYVFWTLDKLILGKSKNPHWNYDGETSEPQTDEMGKQTNVPIPGRNHFPIPRIPFIFLTVFNTGKHPMDDTGLVEQNISKQDLINKRLRQIDKNADNQNNGMLVSGQDFTDEQASDAANALRKGAAIRIPSGNMQAVQRLPAAALPTFIYEQLTDTRTAIRANFGVLGSSPQGIESEDTVRGKIIVKGQDTDRTASIVEEMEHFYDEVFNWFVQMFYVYYDEEHAASILGEGDGREYVTLKAQDLTIKLMVSIKEGSLAPKDELTKANQAIDLWGVKAIDPITLFSRLGEADPKQKAEQLYIWLTNPGALFGQPAPVAPQTEPNALGQGQPPQPAPVSPEVPQAPPAPDLLNQVPTA